MTAKIITIFGRRGSGKTSLVKALTPKLNKFIIYDTLHEYDGHPIVDAIPDLIEALELNEKKIIFRTENDDNFEIVCRIVRETQDSLYLLIDETDNFCSTAFIPPWFQKLIRYGRHDEIGIICVSRRPADLPRLLTSQANYIISFTQHEPRDIAYLKQFIPQADDLTNIGKYEYMVYDADTGQAELNKIPEI